MHFLAFAIERQPIPRGRDITAPKILSLSFLPFPPLSPSPPLLQVVSALLHAFPASFLRQSASWLFCPSSGHFVESLSMPRMPTRSIAAKPFRSNHERNPQTSGENVPSGILLQNLIRQIRPFVFWISSVFLAVNNSLLRLTAKCSANI